MLALLRCHRDGHIWLYCGEGKHVICPKCRTSVIPKLRKVEILWGRHLPIKPSDLAGKAYLTVNNWNNIPLLVFNVVSDDGKSARQIEAKSTDTGIEQERLISCLKNELDISLEYSGEFFVPPSLVNELKLKMEG